MNKPCCHTLHYVGELFSRFCRNPNNNKAGAGGEDRKRLGVLSRWCGERDQDSLGLDANGELKSHWPLLRALLLAPLPVALFFASFTTITQTTGNWFSSVLFAGFAYVYTLAFTGILGIPAFLLLKKKGVNSLAWVALTGAILPPLVVGVIALTLNEPWKWNGAAVALILSGYGAITATAFHYAYAWRLGGGAHNSQHASPASPQEKS